MTNNARLVFGGIGTHKDWMILIIWAYFKEQQDAAFTLSLQRMGHMGHPPTLFDPTLFYSAVPLVFY